jgi:hypothetical protein
MSSPFETAQLIGIEEPRSNLLEDLPDFEPLLNADSLDCLRYSIESDQGRSGREKVGKEAKDSGASGSGRTNNGHSAENQSAADRNRNNSEAVNDALKRIKEDDQEESE